ncbi:unnamed protein product, partial [Effrenium voratum]
LCPRKPSAENFDEADKAWAISLKDIHGAFYRLAFAPDACPRDRLCAFFHRRSERRRPPLDGGGAETKGLEG